MRVIANSQVMKKRGKVGSGYKSSRLPELGWRDRLPFGIDKRKTASRLFDAWLAGEFRRYPRAGLQTSLFGTDFVMPGLVPGIQTPHIFKDLRHLDYRYEPGNDKS
jgi:hypothetical protein